MTSSGPRPTLVLRTLAAIASAALVAAVSHAVSVLAFFVQAGATAGILSQVSGFFAASSFLLFVILALAGALGVFRLRWLAAVVALAAAVLATLLGGWMSASLAGAPLTADVAGAVTGLVTSTYLLFVMAAPITAATIAWRAYYRVTRESPVASAVERRIAVVRRPANNLADGMTTHIDRVAIDPDLADAQWESYLAAFEAAGWNTHEVEFAPELADSVFVEDAAVVFGRTAVLTSPGAESRVAEVEGVATSARRLGLITRRIESPGTLDGGDVLIVGTTAYVGRGGRTNAEGIRQLRVIVAPIGYDVVAVPVKRVLHLKSAVTALPDGTVIGYPPQVEHPELFPRFLATPESGAAVVVLADDTVLIAASAPLTAALLADHGYRVVTVDISEFEKLEGCVTCLSIRIR